MKILVTRAREGAGALSERLLALGYDVCVCPLIRIEPIGGPAVSVTGYDWLVLTSARAVDELFRRGLDGDLPPVAVVGPGTAAALAAHGVGATIVASESTQEGLVQALPRPTGRVLFAAASDARELLAVELDADVVALYRVVEVRPARLPEADLAVLASSSAARSYAAAGGEAPCVSIGPVTSSAARDVGIDVLAEATTHDLEGLLQAVRLAESRIASSRS